MGTLEQVHTGVDRLRESADGVYDRARALVATVSVQSLDSVEALAEQMGGRLLADFPAFGQDADLEGEMHRAIQANLWHVFERVMPGSEGALAAPAEALRFAASVLHRGIDTGELIQAYRVGQNMAWSWWMQRLAARIEERDVLIDAMDISSLRMFAYVDAALDEQVRLWEEERRRWLGRAVALRAEMTRRLLRGELLVPEEVSKAFDHQVDCPLVAAILWEQGAGAGSDPVMSRLEGVADAMARAVGMTRALLIPAGASSLWAWFTAEQAPSIEVLARTAADQIEAHQGVALGLHGEGLQGFRSSHRQARRARRLAELTESGPGVVRFDEVETLCMLGEDAELIGEFVRRKLGGLAHQSPATARLRGTLLVWLQEESNAPRAAARLNTHKNTVLYRLGRAEQALGHELCEDRLGLELALTLAERIGLGQLAGR
ncbi:MAG TPA: helix-turn-helix domain-containing protein [Solirubrobacteraceae bacterium]